MALFVKVGSFKGVKELTENTETKEVSNPEKDQEVLDLLERKGMKMTMTVDLLVKVTMVQGKEVTDSQTQFSLNFLKELHVRDCVIRVKPKSFLAIF